MGLVGDFSTGVAGRRYGGGTSSCEGIAEATCWLCGCADGAAGAPMLFVPHALFSGCGCWLFSAIAGP